MTGRPGMPDRSLDELLLAVSAHLDGEGPDPGDLTDDAEAFRAQALRLRGWARIDAAEPPPDIAAEVMAAVDPPERGRWLRVAAVFFLLGGVVGAVLAGVADRPPAPAAASLVSELLDAQADVERYDASIQIVEYGWHPDVTIRSASGHLAYQAPAELVFTLTDTTAYPDPSWPPNDVVIVVDDEVAWSSGRLGCPLELRPGCLGEEPLVRVVTDRVPFSSGIAALDGAGSAAPLPLDLVVPVGSFLPGATPSGGQPAVFDAVERGDEIVVTTTVAAVATIIEPMLSVGNWRELHPRDVAQIRLDRSTLTLRAVSVWAADGADRERWAIRHGYRDAAGSPLLSVTLTPEPHQLAVADLPPPAVPGRSEGFSPSAEAGGAPEPSWIPAGHVLYRTGQVDIGGTPSIGVRAWTDGRAWVVLRSTDEWAEPRLFGEFRALVRTADLGAAGVGYVDPSGTRVALHARNGVEVELSGTVGQAALLRMAGSLGLLGEAVPETWMQAPASDPIPAGALRPTVEAASRVDDGVVTIAVAAPGRSGWILSQTPGSALPPPSSPDVVSVEVRDVRGRWDADLGTLSWVDEGWVVHLSSEGLPLSALVSVAESLEH